MMMWTEERLGASSQPAANADLGNQVMDVFRGDAIRDDGAGKLRLDIEMDAVLASRTHKVLDEIHSAARPDPTVKRIGIGGFDQHIVVEKNVAVERQVSERREPRRRIQQLVSDHERHGWEKFLVEPDDVSFVTIARNLTGNAVWADCKICLFSVQIRGNRGGLIFP